MGLTLKGGLGVGRDPSVAYMPCKMQVGLQGVEQVCSDLPGSTALDYCKSIVQLRDMLLSNTGLSAAVNSRMWQVEDLRLAALLTLHALLGTSIMPVQSAH